ncbi:8-oxoguanine deaminase [Devosia sp. FKR38]|uniref:8-oxoguanine deaminase n=1 Tax=Devosia sp. FKR38 TaxID=2562312 RepID=UPI0010BFBE1C|nr:8-oxoguanine deaminase [Devosia sp. FKR38]
MAETAAGLWIKAPLAMLADGAGNGLVVRDGRIVELVPTGAVPTLPYAQSFDASRHVVIPGLVNTHHHMFQTLTRAHPAAINKSLWPWIKALYPIWARGMRPDAFRTASQLAMTELMLSGCTCASDHQYLFTPGLEDAMDIQAEEAGRLGLRMTLTRGAIDLMAGDGEQAVAPRAVIQKTDAILADCERILGRYHDRSDGAMLQVALAPNAPFDVSFELMVETARLSAQTGCGLHTHLVETRAEADFVRSEHGCDAVDFLDQCGWLNERVWLAHGIHFDDSEVARLGKHGVGICHCPTSNMVLASGTCRTKDLEAAGCKIGLGVDGSASNDNSNLMESLRHALMLGRLTYGAEAITHLDVLNWATEGSAACLGRSDIGRIAVGKQADLAFFTLDELRFSGAGDALAALVLCGAHHADRVMVQGRWTVEDGQPVGIDLARLRHEHGAAAKAFAESL